MKQVVISRYGRKGANGDRAPSLTPYFDYAVHVVDEDETPSGSNEVHEIRGYDYFNSHVSDLAKVEQEAVVYATRLARAVSDGKIRKAWEEGRINYAVTLTIPICAASEDEARKMIFDKLTSAGISFYNATIRET